MRKLDRFYPPGYPLKEELFGFGLFLGMACIFNFRYLVRLKDMIRSLYLYRGAERFLRPDAVAKSFSQLAEGCWYVFLAPLLFLVMMAVGHYLFYWQQTKSIYVMRRIPKRGVTLFSCFGGSALSAVLLMLVAALLYGLYLCLYWLLVPAECMPRFL